MARGDQLVTGSTTIGLRALRGQQVPEAGRAANQLSGAGNLEALGDGLFGLLHGESGRKQRTGAPLARGNLAKKKQSPGEGHSPGRREERASASDALRA